MKKMKKIYGILMLAMLAMCSVAFVSCGDDDDDNPLIGTWEREESVNVGNPYEDHGTDRWIFKSNGSGSHYQEVMGHNYSFSYTIIAVHNNSGVVRLSFDYGSYDKTFSVMGKTLAFDGNTYTKK